MGENSKMRSVIVTLAILALSSVVMSDFTYPNIGGGISYVYGSTCFNGRLFDRMVPLSTGSGCDPSQCAVDSCMDKTVSANRTCDCTIADAEALQYKNMFEQNPQGYNFRVGLSIPIGNNNYVYPSIQCVLSKPEAGRPVQGLSMSVHTARTTFKGKNLVYVRGCQVEWNYTTTPLAVGDTFRQRFEIVYDNVDIVDALASWVEQVDVDYDVSQVKSYITVRPFTTRSCTAGSIFFDDGISPLPSHFCPSTCSSCISSESDVSTNCDCQINGTVAADQINAFFRPKVNKLVHYFAARGAGYVTLAQTTDTSKYVKGVKIELGVFRVSLFGVGSNSIRNIRLTYEYGDTPLVAGDTFKQSISTYETGINAGAMVSPSFLLVLTTMIVAAWSMAF